MRIITFLILCLAILCACSEGERKILIEAHLVDDFSSIDLVFYQDSTFEQSTHSLLGMTIENTGTYTLKQKEIWLNGELNKQITPEFLYMLDDKLIEKRGLKEGLDTTFASFYRIRTNNIRNTRQPK